MEDFILTELNGRELRISPLTDKGRSVLRSLKSNYSFDTKNVFTRDEFDAEMKYRKLIGDSINYTIKL
jgi:hypothetical protein